MEYEDLTQKIIGCAMTVHRALGPGFLESVYQNVLAYEMRKAALEVECEKRLQVTYDGIVVDDFSADMLVNRSIVIENKAVQTLVSAHEAQLVNYLTTTGIEAGLLLNFGSELLEFKRKTRTYRPKKFRQDLQDEQDKKRSPGTPPVNPVHPVKDLEEWEIPRDADPKWSDETKKYHVEWWQTRIARQKEIDASIAAKAEHEYLYDKPYEDKKKVRVAGPFTVESLSPHRVLVMNENDELVDNLAEQQGAYTEERDFVQMILENLKTAGVQQAHKEDKITFTALTPWPGDLICACGTVISDEWLVASEKNREQSEPHSLTTSYQPLATEKRSAIFSGSEFGTVSRPDLVSAAREAGDAGFDVLIACAFNYDAHSSEFDKLGRIPVLEARMNADLHMADDLMNTGKGNLFVIFGEPDVEVTSGQWLVTRNGRMVDNYDGVKKPSGLGSLGEINRIGRDGLSRLVAVSSG